MKTNSLLEKALTIAYNAHAGQVDKAGEPYILHPLRVMLKMNSDEEKIVALLHDVVEDTDITIDALSREGFSPEVVNAIAWLSKSPDVPYEQYINNIKQDPIAAKVKLGDLADNMNMSRLKTITQKDEERLKKYGWAQHELST